MRCGGVAGYPRGRSSCCTEDRGRPAGRKAAHPDCAAAAAEEKEEAAALGRSRAGTAAMFPCQSC